MNEVSSGNAHTEKEPKAITFKVDDESFTTTEDTLTPDRIMRDFAKVDPATHYVVRLKGQSDKQESYEGRSSESIKMRPNLEFATLSLGPTTVS